MKKKIEIYVRACDKCGRTEMELRICMGCGKTLCGFCSHDMGDKYSMATRNRLHAYDGYAMFRNCFKYDFVREEYGDISICIECLVKPDAHHIGTLLKQCNKMGKLISDDAVAHGKFETSREDLLDKINNSIHYHRKGKFNAEWWRPSEMNTISGERVKDDE